jgi:helicase
MRAQTFELREQLKYCSPLGPLLRSVQGTNVGGDGPKVGIQTIRRLEGAGIRTLAELSSMQLADLVRLGVRRDLAKQIQTYLRRRLQ